MVDDENKQKADLFGDSSAAKPLFGADESLPQGKPLFNNDLEDDGDAAFVRPLFADTEEEETLEDFRKYDDIPENDDIDSPYEADDEYEEPAEEAGTVPVEDTFSASRTESSAEEEPVSSDPVSPEPAPAALFAEGAVSTDSAAPVKDNVFTQQTPVPEPAAYTAPASPLILAGDLESMSLGALMIYARESAGLSPEDVYDGTKINEKYLLAIEREDFEKLPSGSFPGAYVRTLCSFYHLDKNAKEIAQKKAAAYCTQCRPPDDVYNQLNEHAIINKEEQEKFKKIVMISGVILFSLILTIVTVTVIVSVKKKAPEAAPAVSPVTVESLEKLSPEPPQIKASELNVPR
ncbi:MAG: helix-turn-helix domain-containing protein [Lentisphaeria bacterium]|nr:helix-turn-helix domain-containing protein [Lentisphaeria bacterium]